MLVWGGLGAALIVPIAAAAFSPLLAWRQPVYIAAGFAGIGAMALLLLQPLLAGGLLPGLPVRRARLIHRWAGAVLVLSVGVHLAGLALTSPPDVLDALLFRAPTLFSVFGVVAMWAVFAAALLAVFRRRLSVRTWRLGHTGLVTLAVAGSVVHAMLIEGTMETVSKAVLCALVLAATVKAVNDLRAWALIRPRRNRAAGSDPAS